VIEKTKLTQAAEILAAASSTQNPKLRLMYLAEARVLIVSVTAELTIATRALERMEEELARVPYEGGKDG
jgi:hypothetical protein